MSDKEQRIDTGDSVYHAPTGERWLVAYVQGDRLAWCGWPQGEGKLSDCTLIESATEADRIKILNQMADMRNDSDPRCRCARARLKEQVDPRITNEVIHPQSVAFATDSGGPSRD